ncbi:MAG: ABC transporter substrate-binding protein [Acidobacteriota bacterium]|nr:ABC transporter substrate-binding protein [Acidobacteriota bacterium]
MSLNRLRVGAVVGSLVLGTLALSGGAGSATPLKSVTFAYDFPGPDFELVPLVVAQREGYFASAGIKVKVVFPPDTSTTTKMLAVGRADIGMLTTSDMVVAVDAGAPVLSVANYSMHNNWGLFAKPGTNLSAATLKTTLKGKKIFSYGDTWTEAMLPFVLRYAGLSASQVKIFTDPTGYDLNFLLAGKVDFSTNTTNYELPGYAGTGKPGQLAQLLGTKAGAPDVPIWVYAVTRSYASAHGATVKAFLTAVKRATAWAARNPAAAAGMFDMAYPKSGYSDAYNKLGWSLTIPFLTNAKGQYFVQTNAQWSTLATALKGIKLISHVAAPATYYTNKFLP